MSGPASPHAPLSATTSFPPTGAATPALPPQPTPALPSPATFDVLPDLHKLLSRLISTSAQPPAPTPTPSQPSGDGPLEIQNLVTAATELKMKIKRARNAVQALPGIERTCEDQDEEMRELEERIRALKEVLGKMGTVNRGRDEDQTMTG